ncbi:MAG: pantetheine-phosphate adenylyltransferase [Negativicutes bacterium]
MVRAVCSGSFDPVTCGHIDIFERASKMFDEIIVSVFHNIRKEPWLPVEERVRLIREATRHIKNLRACSFSGLLTDFMRDQKASVIVRGLRSVTDFEYEMQEAQTLKHLDKNIETIFILTSQEYYFVSSSGIRELALFNGNVHGLVPACVEEAIRAKVGANGDGAAGFKEARIK